MAIGIEKLHPTFFAEISGVDLTKPLTADEFSEIRDAIDEHSILLFRDQPIDDKHQVAFTRLFGPVMTNTNYHRPGQINRLANNIQDVSNIDHDGTMLPPDAGRLLHSRANRLWHTDTSYKHIPARYSLLSCHEKPPSGGNTAFADTRAAYEDLPADRKKELDGLTAWHSIIYSRSKLGFSNYSEKARSELPPAHQVVIRTHPRTGRKSLYIASHVCKVDGMSEDESQALIDELIIFASQEKYVYEHEWRVGDLVMWDDRCTMHRSVGYSDTNHRRDMRRTTVSDELNSVERMQGQEVAA
tara:strand:+ start:59 stop:958 length:900 start_codon:yes stop_codon:yes gene_type:complete